jgi:EAL domain-containing protein (putative c-di-GMP-specific phosphodiesterase class I)
MGFEALLRWQNPIRGLLLPSEFIPTLELSDLIHPVTVWVIENAVKQCKIWQQMGYSFIIAANVSARNLLDQQLPEKIGAILARHELDSGFLELEITESSLIADPDRSFEVLRRLHEIGVQLSIDDFGTGYSSLAYLQKLPVDSLKIDRSFVMDSGHGREGRSIVGSIIGLAHNLRVSVTAEGVEDNASLQLLRDLGCDHAQGYYISKPLPVENVDAWLKQSRWEPARRD